MKQEVSMKFEDRMEEANRLADLGHIFRAKNDLEKALEYYKAALSIYSNLGNRQGECEMLGNIGLTFIIKGYVEEALKFHRAALEVESSIGSIKKKRDERYAMMFGDGGSSVDDVLVVERA